MELPKESRKIVSEKTPEKVIEKVVASPKVEDEGVEAKKLELIEDSSVIGPDRDKLLHRISQRYPNKRIAWPNKKDIYFRHLGWKMLQFTNGGADVKEVTTVEEAERTTDTVLCWRDAKVDEIQRSQDESQRKKFNQFSRQEENPQFMADAVNKVLGIDGVKAVAD